MDFSRTIVPNNSFPYTFLSYYRNEHEHFEENAKLIFHCVILLSCISNLKQSLDIEEICDKIQRITKYY